ncbi:MAG TPA: hypothetical protein VFO07_00810, partial [Roseiflexaceae bacterium]|nr:hypothetical protein [Roseiflexaceae bacterium]
MDSIIILQAGVGSGTVLLFATIGEIFAERAGVPIGRYTVLVMMLSGGLAGLAGMSEISGVVHRLQGA